jgi:hypothetical protein
MARVVLPSTIAAGAHFLVTYEPLDPAVDARSLSPDIRLAFWRGGTRLHHLISGAHPVILEPDDYAIPAPKLLGGGPYGFRLPVVAPGRYMLCGAVGFETDQYLQRWCRHIDVAA